jgi:hypothetical protein
MEAIIPHAPRLLSDPGKLNLSRSYNNIHINTAVKTVLASTCAGE